MSINSQYQRERQRVQDLVKKLEQKGYYFNDDVIPKIPNKITQGSINKLQNITLKTLYNEAYLVLSDGDYIKGKKALKIELERYRNIKQEYVMQRTQYYETIYDNFVKGLRRIPSPVFKALQNIMQGFEQEIGKERIAIALEEMPESFHMILAQHRYDSEASVSDFTSRLLAYVPDLGRLEREQLSDIIEENENYVEPE